MLEAAVVLALCGFAYWLGWKHRDNWDWLRALQLKRDHPEVLNESHSSIIEPRYETPSEKALREQKELTDSLNP